MKRAAQLAVFVLCVAFTIGAIVNVFVDNTEVEKLAKEVACEGASAAPGTRPAAPAKGPAECAMSMTRMSRTPFGQSFEFSGRSVTRRIRCTRSLVMFGEYSCAVE
jgi:hypothetical protein